MASAFVLEKNTDGKFHFNLRDNNNEKILTSELYETKDGALNGIKSVRENAPEDDRYERKTASNDSPYFVLTATNGKVIGTSELYSSESAREKGIKAVKETAPKAPLEDNTK